MFGSTIAMVGLAGIGQRFGFLVREHAATGEETHALRRFQREAGAVARDHVDDELGVFPKGTVKLAAGRLVRCG